jgi:hypothetical protein
MEVPLPFVMRKDGDTYHLVGNCYIHGIMDGEIWQSEVSQYRCGRVMGILNTVVYVISWFVIVLPDSSRWVRDKASSLRQKGSAQD